MSEADDLLGGTVDDYLLSLATGLRAASDALSRPRAGSDPGVAPTTYVLPKLEFELTMALSLSKSPAVSNKYIHGGNFAAPPIQMKHVVMMPVAPASTSAASGQTLSKISGSFLAVPANDGRPATLISSFLQRIAARQIQVSVLMITAAGEPIVGAEVHFNIDRSQDVSTVTSATEFTVGVVITEADGRAVNTLEIDAAESVGAKVFIVIDAAGETEQVLYMIENTGG